MEPISPGPNLPAEKMGSPNRLLEGTEKPLVSSIEKKEEKVEARESADSADRTASGVPILPTPTRSIVVEPVSSIRDTTQDDSPMAANDDDVIEREWVQRAKKIVLNTRNDPYMQEKQMSRLQADYVKKRHGKDLKVSD